MTGLARSHLVHLLMLLVGAVHLSGCSPFYIGAVAPTPTVSLARSRLTLALVIGPHVADEVPESDHIGAVQLPVKKFHISVRNGFIFCFQPYYRLVSTNADLTLHIEALRIEIGGGHGELVVHYAARLDRRDGTTVGRSFGALTPPHRIGAGWRLALSEALARFYEKLAADLFVRRSVSP
ncbi:MAG: hypothetical protein KC609_21975 [Myxococcales bacterium]|nr:hypothetical protein [Myxococcales bacterium]